MTTPTIDASAAERRFKKAAAIGGALWVVPAVQSVNMSQAWAQVGSDSPVPMGHASEQGPVTERRYTVRFDIGRRGAVCSPSRPAARRRCLAAEPLAGGCSDSRGPRTTAAACGR